MRSILAALLLALCAAPASAGTLPLLGAGPIATGSTSLCPYGAALPDGCSGAPISSAFTFQVSDLMTSFGLQSGQTYFDPHPQTYNVAAVDYPVGPAPSGGVLLDPATLPTASGVCRWTPATTRIICQNDAGAGATLDGYDMTRGGTDCIYVQINQTSVTGPVVVTNNKWIYKSGSSCAINGKMIAINGGSSINFSNNYLNGCGLTSGASRVSECASQWTGNINQVVIAATTGGAVTAQYNAFINNPARALSYSGANDFTFKWNYAEQTGNAAAHGEFTLNNFASTTTPTTMNNWSETYNTLLQPAAALINGTTALISTYEGVVTFETASILATTMTVTAVSSGTIKNGQYVMGTGVTEGTRICDNVICTQSGSGVGGIGTYTVSASQTITSRAISTTFAKITNATIDHNTLINNKNGASVTTGQVLAFSYIPHTNVTITNNYMDPTGTNFCAAVLSVATIGTPTMSGNIDLLDGSAVNTWVNPRTTGLSCTH